MTVVAEILTAIEQGDPQAAEQLLPLVYDELRQLAAQRLANEAPGQTLQATALVHEAYLRLVGVDKEQQWDSRRHFFAAATEAMRRVLLDRARDKKRQKRGGGLRKVDLDSINIAIDTPFEDLHAVDEALEMLAAKDPLCAELVKLRFYAGLTQGEASAALGIARRTGDKYWAFARAWLFQHLRQGD
jgi:RNA polymerase sigma factor (TIGR02999 family)